MKTKIYLIIMLCTMTLALTSCSGKDEDEERTTELIKEYKEACANFDWNKAYNAVDELGAHHREVLTKMNSASNFFQSKYDQYGTQLSNAEKAFKEGKKYVIRQECLYLIDQGTLSVLPRIAVIVQENDAKWLYDELILIAESMQNEDLRTGLCKLRGDNYINSEYPVEEYEY